MKNFICSLFFTFISTIAFSQNKAVISGIVNAANNTALEQATVYIKNSSFISETNQKGYYVLEVPQGTYDIVFSREGFKEKTITVDLKEGENKNINIFLEETFQQLDEIIINTKSAIQKVKESPFNVVALDAKAFYNTTMDLGKVLDKASGVKIRESGGVGSDMSISLNGFTGNHVKVFMDGVPMQGFGSAFQLNNIPVGIADRIEVYKGVVPIEFGADALGGVINIVTNQTNNTYVDASYSYGSFNTHKTNINVGHTTKKGFTFQLNAYQNYSDNDYKVKTQVLYLTGPYAGNRFDTLHWVRRFNNTYHNEAVVAKVGVVKKKWADRFLIGATFSQEYAEVQHANLMKYVYGEKNGTNSSVLPSLTYEKRNLFVKGLNVRLNANYNSTRGHNYDTINRQYNWFGEWIESNTKGEYGKNTLAQFKNTNASANANISYQINHKHSIGINNVISGYRRKNTDAAAIAEPGTVLDTIQRTNLKNVLGLSYRYRHNEKWTTNLILKQYNVDVTGPVNVSTTTNKEELVRQSRKYGTTGHGLATTYTFENVQLKASWEKAYRLPTDRELFGDEILETGNTTLQAENSLNYNLGAVFNKQIGEKHTVYVDVNGYYRDTKDYIRRVIDARYGSGGSVNHGNVLNKGIDAEVRYYYENKFSVGGNITYQDLRNNERYEKANSNQPSVTYKDRVPNVPYFFGNADATYYLHNLGAKGNVLAVGYTFNFVEQYYLNWESLGTANTKDILPRQLYSDVNITYSLQNGKYNIAFEARNIENAFLYDNFSLQKPGRSFAVKFRYFFNKKNNN